MKRRFVILVDWNPVVAGGDVQAYGTWSTWEAAEEQRERWERAALRQADGDGDATPIIWTVELAPKVRSGFRDRLRAWWTGVSA